MTPEEKQLLNNVAKKVEQLADLYHRTHQIDKVVHSKPVYFYDKIGFFRKTPIGQQSSPTAPSGGGTGFTDSVDISARTAISQIRTILTNLGLTT